MRLKIPQSDLESEVFSLVQQIPRGKVTTYGDLARALGDDSLKSVRWLGGLLHVHVHTPSCVCHRVVRSNGEVGLHVSGASHLKAELLHQEGVVVSSSGHVDLAHRFTAFRSHFPLRRLREFQTALRDRVIETALTDLPKTFGAVDVAYQADGTACGAYVLVEAKTLRVLEQLTICREVWFPYIPGYLTFRELPVMLELVQQAQTSGILGDVLFCDGNGKLHPWKSGIATCVGVLMDHPTLGVGKTLLCGNAENEDAEFAAEVLSSTKETLGSAIRISKKSKPVYISVGHRITLEDAVRVARSTFAGHRVPEPIFLADRLTKQIKRGAN